MDVLLLGPIEARLDGLSISLGARKQRAVLAMLALEVGRTVSADALAEGLWGEHPPASAPKLVQLYVSHLRRLLDGTGAQIVTRGRGYELRLADGEVDAVRFERLLEQGRAREALALWRGEPLADVAGEPFAPAEIRRLEELRVRAAELAIEGDLAAGRHGEVIGELDALVEEHPLRERLHAQRMLALYRAGRQAEALDGYRRARAVLVEQIGVEPGPELQRLHAAVLAQDPALVHGGPAAPPGQGRAPPARRRQRVLLATGALVLFAGLVTFGISRVTRQGGLAGIAENAVGVIEPDSRAITAQYSVGRGPSAVVAGDGSVWIANTLDGTVTRIDGEGHPVRITVGGAPVALAFGGRSLWVADGDARDVVQVDPRENKVEQRLPVGNAPRALAMADGALWVAAGAAIERLDLDRARVTQTIPLTATPTAIAAGADSLWVASEEAGTVTRIEPRTGTVAATIGVGHGPSAVAAGEGAVWVVNRYDGTLWRIDPATNAVASVVRVGDDRARWLSSHLTSLAYDGLVAYRRVGGNAGTTLIGGLATDAPRPSSDGRTYVFTLRRGLRYSGGRPVQPEDFRSSLERFLRVTGDRFFPPYYDGIVGARRCARRPARCDLSAGIATDRRARTITIHLTAPDAELLHKLTLPFAYVVPGGTPLRRTGGHVPPGTGPYRFTAWKSGRGGELVRNPYFRPGSRPAGFADRIVVGMRRKRAIDTEIADVERGAADLAFLADPSGNFVGPRRLAALAARAPGQLHSAATTTTEWMFLNVHRRPFDDPDVRRALNDAIDRARVVELEGGANVASASCQIVPAILPEHETYCPYGTQSTAGRGWTAPDLARARRVVAASGRSGERVVVWAPESRSVVGRYFVGLLDDLGFRASSRVEPDGPYIDLLRERSTRAQIGFGGWSSDFLTASNFIVPHFGCVRATRRPDFNFSYFCDPELDRQIEQARSAQGAEASERWAAADRRIVDLAPAVPLTNLRDLVFVSKRVGNVQHHPQWFTLLDQLWLR